VRVCQNARITIGVICKSGLQNTQTSPPDWETGDVASRAVIVADISSPNRVGGKVLDRATLTASNSGPTFLFVCWTNCHSEDQIRQLVLQTRTGSLREAGAADAESATASSQSLAFAQICLRGALSNDNGAVCFQRGTVKDVINMSRIRPFHELHQNLQTESSP
jgi:hypothetical protein